MSVTSHKPMLHGSKHDKLSQTTSFMQCVSSTHAPSHLRLIVRVWHHKLRATLTSNSLRRGCRWPIQQMATSRLCVVLCWCGHRWRSATVPWVKIMWIVGLVWYFHIQLLIYISHFYCHSYTLFKPMSWAIWQNNNHTYSLFNQTFFAFHTCPHSC